MRNGFFGLRDETEIHHNEDVIPKMETVFRAEVARAIKEGELKQEEKREGEGDKAYPKPSDQRVGVKRLRVKVKILWTVYLL